MKLQAMNAKPIIQFNPINKQKILFDSINTIHVKLGFNEQAIRKAIKSNQLFHGSYWQYK
jgi:hypothetical protein